MKVFKALSWACWVLLVGAPQAVLVDAAPADEFKPALVVSISGYDELIEDLNYVGEVALSSPQLGEQIEQFITLFTQGQGLVGLDEKKPWGLAVSTDGVDFDILAFLPVDDCKPLMEALAALNPEELDGGVWRITVPQFNLEIHAQSKDGWTFFATKEESLAKLPADPMALLDGLNEKYDIAARASLRNLPENFREMAMNALQGGFAEGLAQGGGPGKDLQNSLGEEQLAEIEGMLKGLDQITFGWTTDREDEKVRMDLTITAVPGSDYAKQMQFSDKGETRFSGFLVEDAPLVLNVNQSLATEQLAGLDKQMQQLRDTLPNMLQDFVKTQGGSDRAQHASELMHGFIGDLMDVVTATLKDGKIDVAMSLLGKGPHTLVAAAAVSDTAKLTKLIEDLKSKADELEPPIVVQLNTGSHGDVKFHLIELPMNESEAETFEKLFGSEPRIAVGVGKDAAYLALGSKPIEQLKERIDACQSAGNKSVPPLYVRAELAPLVALANEMMTAMAAEQEAKAAEEGAEEDTESSAGNTQGDDEQGEEEEEGKEPAQDSLIPGLDLQNLDLSDLKFDDDADRVEITLQPVTNGMNIHVEAEEGLLVVLGSVLRLVAQSSPIPIPGVQ